MDYAFVEKLKGLDGYLNERAITQILYAKEVSDAKNGAYDALLDNAIEVLKSDSLTHGAITKQGIKAFEEALLPMQADAKSYELLLVSHAHIDMNWQWGYDETVSITLSTFDTMLKLMEEYDGYTFSQSQASTYEIVAKYDPDMLEKIKARIKEGRWEVTASQWVEGDKNLATGEDLTRHIIKTTDYLSKLLDIDKESLNIAFEPDTFGHNINMPEIYANGGVRFMYHCRGLNPAEIYLWRAPSGKSVKVFCEHRWYLDMVNGKTMLGYVPRMEKYKIKKFLRVYGVGDHGGGATRQDLNRIEDMKTWPIMPKLKYSTYSEWFKYLDAECKDLPVYDGELNRVFTGCYSSQSSIKKGNAIGGRTLVETEKVMAGSMLLAGKAHSGKELDDAWRKHLFNQFHDILPGSGVRETRECASASFMEINALCGVQKTKALKEIFSVLPKGEAIAETDFNDGFSFGAGAGVNPASGVFLAEQSSGNKRVFLLYNPASTGGMYTVDIRLWDFNANPEFISVKDSDGNPLDFYTDKIKKQKAFHKYYDLKVRLELPALGVTTVTVDASNEHLVPTEYDFMEKYTRHHEDYSYVLEDDFARVEFSPDDGRLVAFIDKANGKEYRNENGLAHFTFVGEDTREGMSSWVQGRRKRVVPITSGGIINSCRDKPYQASGIGNGFEIKNNFGASDIKYFVSLKDGVLEFNTTVNFKEFASSDIYPTLEFTLNKNFDSYCYDVPFGVIDRSVAELDNPALSFIAGTENNCGLLLLCEGKYGYRGSKKDMAVTLIRGTDSPDPIPEIGKHEFIVRLGAVNRESNLALLQKAEKMRSLTAVMSIDPATLPFKQSFAQCEGVLLSTLKPSEDGKGVIVRLVEVDGKTASATIKINGIKQAFLVDGRENVLDVLAVNKDNLKVDVNPFSVTTVKLVL